MSVKINFSANDAGFTSTVERIKNSTKSMDSSFAKTSMSIVGSLGKITAAGAAIGTAAVAGIAALGVKLNSIGEEARAAEDRLRNVTSQMGLFGNQAGSVADRLIELADATERQTGIDGEIIQTTQAKLMTFKELAATASMVGGSFDRATQAAIDLAAAGFGSAEQNATQLGKALQDPIKGMAALARSGVTFTEQEREKIKTLAESGQMLDAQRVILEAIEKQVGGTAEATATNTSKMRASFGQLIDEIAVPFSQAFDQIPGKLESVFPMLKEKARIAGLTVSTAISEAIEGDTERLIQIFSAIGNIVGAAFETAFRRTLRGIGTKVLEIATFAGMDGDTSFAENRDLLNKEDMRRLSNELRLQLEKIAVSSPQPTANDNASFDFAQDRVDQIPFFKQWPYIQPEIKKAAEELKDAGESLAEDAKAAAMEDLNRADAMGKISGHVKSATAASVSAAKEMKSIVAVSAGMMEQINNAKASEKLDPGGRISAQFEQAMASGNMAGAGRAQRRMEMAEQNKFIQDAFNPGKAFGKSLQDIAKEQGIDRFGKTSKQLREELIKKAEDRAKEMAPGAGGEPAGGKDGGKGGAKEDPIGSLVSKVQEILTVVTKIEPKLPTTALAT
jgi:hypothetical protein